MTPALRRPALAAAAVRAAPVRDDDPTAALQDHYQQIWLSQMHDMPFVNAALVVEAIGFARRQGDWLGVVVTPWFLNLFLLNGGGTLWQDVSAGARRPVTLPCGTLQFIADDDPALGLVQYCPLIAPVTALPDMASARVAAADALNAVLAAPPGGVSDGDAKPLSRATALTSRRTFLRANNARH